ncbi:Protein CBG10730 [Caenorhabditis briggsae]|uniref:Protein CBG10730 n=1 Tax=Caenorhabditis briggsae TaxID=6238 RepID=A8XBN4_CAEBR|nr:Protein CBG10730 [Caenorhabditis briggsae]CAP30050.2 Protein CBG10730 [Caenorhabditis briggsae]
MSSDDTAAKKKQMMQNFLNRKRKIDLKVGEEIQQKPSTSSETIEKDEKEKKEEEKFDKIPSTNKEFLRRTIQSTMPRGKKKK